MLVWLPKSTNGRASHVGAATLFIGPPAAADVSADDDAAAAATAAEGDDDETKRAGRKDDRPNPAPVPNRALQMSPFNSTNSTMGADYLVPITDDDAFTTGKPLTTEKRTGKQKVPLDDSC